MSEAASSSTLWASAQILGLIFIEVMDALRYPADQGNPNGNMQRALLLVAICALVAGTTSFLYRSRNYRMESEAMMNSTNEERPIDLDMMDRKVDSKAEEA